MIVFINEKVIFKSLIIKKKYPNTEIANMGIVGYECNEHGPNESVDLDACKKFIAALVVLMSEY